MSKLIVEMEIPKNGCSKCRLKYKRRGYGGVFYCFNHLCVDKWTYGRTQNGDRPSWCPIKGELPEEHGDLIDRSLLCADLVGVILSNRGLGIDEVIARQPAIIEAERKDDE